MPANITIVKLPAKCPELNPVCLGICAATGSRTGIFASYNAIVDHCCRAGNRLAQQPWRVISIGLRDWATGQTG